MIDASDSPGTWGNYGSDRGDRGGRGDRGDGGAEVQRTRETLGCAVASLDDTYPRPLVLIAVVDEAPPAIVVPRGIGWDGGDSAVLVPNRRAGEWASGRAGEQASRRAGEQASGCERLRAVARNCDPARLAHLHGIVPQHRRPFGADRRHRHRLRSVGHSGSVIFDRPRYQPSGQLSWGV